MAYLEYHRHLTHALVALPFLPLLPLAIVGLATRGSMEWMRAYAVSLLGVASHLMLDSTNIYGIRLLLPFSDRWFRLDITGVVDIWIWAILLVGVLGPVLARLVNLEIGANHRYAGRGLALFAVALLVLFEFGRFVLHERAGAMLESRIYAGEVPRRVAALPTAFNPFGWRGLVETSGFYALVPVDVRGEFDPSAAKIFYKPEPSPAMESARSSEAFQAFLKFSQYPLWRITPVSEPENGLRVEAMDLRFGNPREPAFVATAIVDSRLRVLHARFTFGRAGPR